MKILFVNEIENATVTSLYGTNTYPASSIYHVFLRKKFKSNLDTDTLTIDLPAAVNMTSFFMGFHNVIDGTVSFFDGALAPVGTPISLLSASDIFASHFAQISVKRITIEAETSGNPLYIGGVGAGKSVTMPTAKFLPVPFPLGKVEKTTVVETAGGQVSRNRGSSIRERFPMWIRMPEATVTNLMAEFDDLGIGKPVFIDLFENDPTFDPPIYAYVVDPVFPTYEGPDMFTISVKIREAR